MSRCLAGKHVGGAWFKDSRILSSLEANILSFSLLGIQGNPIFP